MNVSLSVTVTLRGFLGCNGGMMQNIQNIDLSILNYIYDNLTNPFLDMIMPFITAIGDKGLLYILLSIVLISIKKTRKYGLMLGTALLLGLIFGNIILKNVIARPRPYIYRDVDLLINTPKDHSFPSGHTMASFEVASVLFYANKRVGGVMLVIASLVAYSRLYLYVHFPTDVIAGCLLGTIFGMISVKLWNMINAKYSLSF